MRLSTFGLLIIAWSFFGTLLNAQIGALVSALPSENPELVEGIRAAREGDNDKAEALFATMMKKHPGMRPPGIDAALSFADPGYDAPSFGRMRFWLEKTAENYPDDPEAFILLADIAFSEGRYLECSMLNEQAGKLAEKYEADAVRRKELSLYVDKLRAGIAERRCRWSEAETVLKRLHREEPEVGMHLYRLGLAQFRLGDKDAAIRSLTDAESIDGKMLPALIELARISESEGNREEALRMLDEALEKNGENPRTLVAAADFHLKWNRLDKVRELAEKAKRIDPESADAELTLGIVDLYAGDFTQAEQKFARVADALPDNVQARVGLALALCEQDEGRQRRRAHSIARLNAERNPLSVDAQTTLAWVLVRAESLDEAEKILLREFDFGRMNSPGAYYLAVIYSKQQRNDEAILFLRHALAENVNFPKRVAAEKLLKSLTGEH